MSLENYVNEYLLRAKMIIVVNEARKVLLLFNFLLLE